MAIRLAVNVVQCDLDQPRQLGLDTSPELAEARATCSKDASHLLDDESAVTFHTQVRGAMVGGSPCTEQQRRILSGIVCLAAAGHVVGASPHYGATRLEQRGTSAAWARVSPAGTVEAQKPLATVFICVFLFIVNGPNTGRTVFIFLGLFVLQLRWQEAISNPRCDDTAR